MKTILIPTDFSKNAATALLYALELAHRTGASATILHVVYPNEGVDNNVYNAFWSQEYFEQREKALQDWIRRLRRQKKVPAGVKVNLECQIGFPTPSICEVADTIDADLIVMGSTGATGLRGALLGSTAAGVTSKTKRPVLIIPKKAEFRATDSIVFSTDFHGRISTASMNVLKSALAAGKSKLHFVHVLDVPGEQPDKHREAAFVKQFAGMPYDFHYLHDRNVAQAISNFIESTDAGALVAIAHEHNFLERLLFDSITRKLAYRVHVPFLVLHDE